MYRRHDSSRLNLVYCVLLSCLSLLFFRIIYIQVDRSEYLHTLALRQSDTKVSVAQTRGNIYDRNMNPLAVTLSSFSIYAVPRSIKTGEKAEIAEKLAQIMEMDSGELLNRLNKDRYFVWLKRRLSSEKAIAIMRLGIDDIGVLKEPKRYYPNGKLASHILGFAGLDNQGLEGVEVYYDNYLRGMPGAYILRRDAKGRPIYSAEGSYKRKVNGANLILAIDEVIQHIVERQLDAAMESSGAKAGVVVVMAPKTGDILALANRPAFNPNDFQNADPQAMRNRAIADIFEPGSTFKLITAAGVLEEHLVDAEDKFFCENGAFKIGRRILHDHKPYGWLTFPEIIKFSSNIGIAKIAQRLGAKRLYDRIDAFGFGKKSGIDLPGEVQGILMPLEQWTNFSIASVPMGHEIGVTALQLVCAVSAIANKGLMFEPIVVKEIVSSDGGVIESFPPKQIAQPLSEEAARQLTEIMVGVVEEGTGRNAQIEGFRVAGKTGTAQKIGRRGYSKKKFTASFVGFLPADEPEIAMVVILDEPGPVYYGGLVCAPLFKDIAVEVLKYLKVAPAEERVVANDTL